MPELLLKPDAPLSARLQRAVGTLEGEAPIRLFEVLFDTAEGVDAESVAAYPWQGLPRPLKRLYMLGMDALRSGVWEDFPALLAAVNALVDFLPEADPEKYAAADKDRLTGIAPRFAYTSDGTVAYIRLPSGMEHVCLNGTDYTAAQCAAGIYLSGDTEKAVFSSDGKTVSFSVSHPLRRVRFRVVIKAGPVCLAYAGAPLWLKKRFPVFLETRACPGTEIPRMTLALSSGQTQIAAFRMGSEKSLLPCPKPDAARDRVLIMECEGKRLIPLVKEG